MNNAGDGQYVYVINHSTVPIMVTGLNLLDCQNVRNFCQPQQLAIHVAPGQRVNLATVKPDNPGSASSFRFTYTWAPARQP